MKNILKVILVSALGGAITLGAYKIFFEEPQIHTIFDSQPTTFLPTGFSTEEAHSFTLAAEKTVNSVVHVKTAIESNYTPSPLDFFFGNPRGHHNAPRLQMGSGSGVIISEDGYIVTNNHVIANARTIQVTLNNQEQYEANVIGTDPTTDIALIKIEPEEKLPFLSFSNSDDLKLGQWVLAVGNPFNLTSTVTAGIVSAKSRNIGVIEGQSAIESFIQTDAVINPGNSGGALVNTAGELVGINSAISTHTGSFEGYSFAVPSNIVQKVVMDILEYGTVQRAYIGVSISDITPNLAEQLDIQRNTGVYVQAALADGAAHDSGIKPGDIIIAINDRKVSKSSELQELIGRKRPGDKVKITVIREDKKKEFNVELRNMNGTTAVVKKSDLQFVNLLGADLTPLSEDEKVETGLTFGVEVENQSSGILQNQGIPEGFIITHINRREIHEKEDINDAVNGLRKGDPVVIQGYTPGGRARYFAFGY